MQIRFSSRRQFLRQLGLLGALPGILQLRELAGAEAAEETAVIFIQQGGGASQFETYDPKPAAPVEYRGELGPIATNVPGVQFCELLPRQAARMDRLAVVRSITHNEASHIALHMVETGYFLQSSANALRGEMPAVGSVVSRQRGALRDGLPSYITLPRLFAYSGPHYLGAEHVGFAVDDDPAGATFAVKNLALDAKVTADRLHTRQELRMQLDRGDALDDLDGSGAAVDRFTCQALDLITGEKARTAFDLSREPAEVRERYGRNTLGQRMLLARRLVEAGVPYVAIRSNDWDDHDNLFPRMRARCETFDTGIAALLDDLQDRGMQRRVLIVVMGEFGRTPRVNSKGGRDHWPPVTSVMLSGGRYQMGQVIGSSDANGMYVQAAPYAPQSVLGMVYRHLGIDPALTFLDYTGRPRYILEEREPIRELG